MDRGKPQHQQGLKAFFGVKSPDATTASGALAATGRKRKGSAFGECPLCQGKFLFHTLARHAANCTGIPSSEHQPSTSLHVKIDEETTANATEAAGPLTASVTIPTIRNECDGKNASESKGVLSKRQIDVVDSQERSPPLAAPQAKIKASLHQPIPGLFMYEEFITEEEERQILAELDGIDSNYKDREYLPWHAANFNGKHDGKRWGVHCNLRTRQVTPAENELPNFMRSILKPKLQQLSLCTSSMAGWAPNEANAIDYRRNQGHYLKSHVDDRRLSKEPIANLSLAGDCYMTFRQESRTGQQTPPLHQTRVLLKRRCLQVLTGKARYDYSHGIRHEDLFSDRRVSVTIRESPLTTTPAGARSKAAITSPSGPQQPTLTALFQAIEKNHRNPK